MKLYAQQVNVSLDQERPKITLAGYDLIRAQRFGACSLKKPRIGVALNAMLAAEEQIQWQRFCESLVEHSECSVMVLGETKIEMPASKNLSGKLTARESAAVLSQCDILVTTEDNYAALALGVGVDAIIIGPDKTAADGEEYTGIVRIHEFSPERILTAMHKRSKRV
jgi:hypothetical protein